MSGHTKEGLLQNVLKALWQMGHMEAEIEAVEALIAEREPARAQLAASTAPANAAGVDGATRETATHYRTREKGKWSIWRQIPLTSYEAWMIDECGLEIEYGIIGVVDHHAAQDGDGKGEAVAWRYKGGGGSFHDITAYPPTLVNDDDEIEYAYGSPPNETATQDASAEPSGREGFASEPSADHWKQAIHEVFSHPFDITRSECDRIEHRARALSKAEGRGK